MDLRLRNEVRNGDPESVIRWKLRAGAIPEKVLEFAAKLGHPLICEHWPDLPAWEAKSRVAISELCEELRVMLPPALFNEWLCRNGEAFIKKPYGTQITNSLPFPSWDAVIKYVNSPTQGKNQLNDQVWVLQEVCQGVREHFNYSLRSEYDYTTREYRPIKDEIIFQETEIQRQILQKIIEKYLLEI